MNRQGGKPNMEDLVLQLRLLRDLLVDASLMLREAQHEIDVEGQRQASAALEQLLRKIAPP